MYLFNSSLGSIRLASFGFLSLNEKTGVAEEMDMK